MDGDKDTPQKKGKFDVNSAGKETRSQRKERGEKECVVRQKRDFGKIHKQQDPGKVNRLVVKKKRGIKGGEME